MFLDSLFLTNFWGGLSFVFNPTMGLHMRHRAGGFRVPDQFEAVYLVGWVVRCVVVGVPPILLHGIIRTVDCCLPDAGVDQIR